MAKGKKRLKGHTMIYKTPHRKTKYRPTRTPLKSGVKGRQFLLH